MAEKPGGMRAAVQAAEDNRKAMIRAVRAMAAVIQGEMMDSADREWQVRHALRMPSGPKTARVAALILLQGLGQTMGQHRPIAAHTLRHWEHIVMPGSRLRFRPIIPLALRLMRALPEDAQERLISLAAAAGPNPDIPLAGREMQDIGADHRSRLSVFHTRPESAALMARLAIPRERNWGDPERVTRFRVSDYSCGAGELLTAAYRRIRDLHEAAGGSNAAIHQQMLAQALTMADVLPGSVAMAAAGLDAIEPGPAHPGGITRAVTLRSGPVCEPREPGMRTRRSGPRHMGLGSLDLLEPKSMGYQDLTPIGRLETAGISQRNTAPIEMPEESQDVVLMNPPFSRQFGPENLDLNVANPQRGITPTTPGEMERMKRRLTDIRNGVRATNMNGMSLYFSHLAHRMVRTGGTIALLLPASALSGGGGGRGCVKPDEPHGWEVFRGILLREYCDITIAGISGYTNEGSTFSDKTTIAEVMVIARRAGPRDIPDGMGVFASLRKQPANTREAEAAADAILEARERLREAGAEGTMPLQRNGIDLGVAVRTELPEREIWAMARTLRPEIIRTASDLGRGMIRMSGGPPVWLPIAQISEMGRVGITEFETKKLVVESDRRNGEYPSMYGHDSSVQRCLETEPNDWSSLVPGREASRYRLDRSLSRLHLNDNFRYNSQPVAACLTPEPTLGRKAWPNLVLENEVQEKAMALWLNSTVGLVTHWANSNRGQNGLGYLSQAQLKKLPVLDVTRLIPEQLAMMQEIFEEVREIAMLPASEAWRDPVRQELDRRILGEVLGVRDEIIGEIAKIRNRWCLEPTVMGRKGATVNRQEQRRELEALAV